MNNINIERIESASYFLSRSHKNANGTQQVWCRNGKTKTWKTRPGQFRIPVKRGLFQFGYIDHNNIKYFDIA